MAKQDKNNISKFNPSEIEPKWQKVWSEAKTYEPDLDKAAKPFDNAQGKPFYNLMMFPYPSAEGLHVGNVYAQTGSDIQGRFQRMCGNDVFQPFGLDGFGIHSENYALKVGRTPQEHAAISEKNFYRQVHETGSGMAWDEKVETYDPAYYKWTQWLFIQLFKAGLAYRKKAPVNYCPSCKTVLADEQVIDGKCERCGSVVEKRNLEQWFFKITEYSERLLKNIPGLDWSDKVKTAQTNWIGKKEGMEITHKVVGMDLQFQTFTAFPAWSWADTFIVIAPEHPLVKRLVEGTGQEQSVLDFIQESKKISNQERIEDKFEKKGVFTGRYAKDPFGGLDMPIWLANFALMDFGTGIIRCSAHDVRDYEFAQKYNIPLKEVVDRKDLEMPVNAHENEGVLKGSGPFTGKKVEESIGAVKDWIEEKGIGKRVSTYHLRDWLISRQRYWGPPIPLVYCEACAAKGFVYNTNELAQERGIQRPDLPAEMAGWFPIPESELPVRLPETENWKPTGTSESPLAQIPEFWQTTCPNCGGPAKRETDVSDTFLDSSWYFFRYTSTDKDNEAFDQKRVEKWMPVTLYTGGAEHSVLHLLYARFITMVLHDLGYISFEEPFAKFRAHGLIIKDGAKMSKSKGNVVVPDVYIKKFGADTLRSYLMFLGPFSQGGDFSDSGIEGMHRFLRRVWVMVQEYLLSDEEGSLTKERAFMLHKTVKKVTEEMESLRYNTALAALMEWYNFLSKEASLTKEEAETYVKLLAPLAPHMTEELWQLLQVNTAEEHDVEFASVHRASWPTYDASLLVAETVNVVVQINGKVRATLTLPAEEASNESLVIERVKEDENVVRWLEGKTLHKTFFVPQKLLNLVVG